MTLVYFVLALLCVLVYLIIKVGIDYFDLFPTKTPISDKCRRNPNIKRLSEAELANEERIRIAKQRARAEHYESTRYSETYDNIFSNEPAKVRKDGRHVGYKDSYGNYTDIYGNRSKKEDL
jgi:hypothetical protein